MPNKWVFPKPMTNGFVEELKRKFASRFSQSVLNGFRVGGDSGLSGSRVFWTIVPEWEPYAFVTLQLSGDSTFWVVKDTAGDISAVTKMLMEEGFTLQQ